MQFERTMRRLCGVLIIVTQSHTALADTWVDRDGASWISINARQLDIVSVGRFAYFDRIFSQLKPDNARLNLCFGYETTTGKPTACIEQVLASRLSYSNDQVRSITLNTKEHGFFTALTEGALRAGAEIVISVDNSEIYASYAIQRNYKLSDESLRIIRENDQDIAVPNMLRDSSSI